MSDIRKRDLAKMVLSSPETKRGVSHLAVGLAVAVLTVIMNVRANRK